MADEIQIQPSSSLEILDLLLSAGLDKGVRQLPWWETSNYTQSSCYGTKEED